MRRAIETTLGIHTLGSLWLCGLVLGFITASQWRCESARLHDCGLPGDVVPHFFTQVINSGEEFAHQHHPQVGATVFVEMRR
jgi:hypothetical protein